MASLSSHPPLPGSISNYTHTTWAHTFLSHPEFLLQPTSESQLRSVVRLARTSRRRIAVIGSAHSPSYLTCTSSWLVTLRHLNRIVSADPSTGIVVVQAGITLRDLNMLLEREYGLTMPNIGSIDEQSIAGALATGTHGSSLRHGLLCEFVLALKLVMANGETVECRRDAENDDERELFRAASLGLGAIGIVTEVTFRAVPAFSVKWSQTIQPDEAMLALWDAGKLWERAEFVRVWWLPHTRRALVWSADKVEGVTKEVIPNKWPAISHKVHAFLHGLAHHFPRLMPWVEWFIFGMQFGFKNGATTSGIQRSSQGLLVDCLYSQLVNEWAIPLSKGPEALRRLSALIDSRHPIHSDDPNPIPRSRIYTHSPVEIRVSKPSASPQSYLDQTCRHEPTVFLNATLYRPLGLDPPNSAEWYSTFEGVMRDLGGRPHWAKNFKVGAEELAEMYGDDLWEWKDIRKRVDPDGVFVGPWLREKVLGKEGERLECEEVEVGREHEKHSGGVEVFGKVGE